MATTEQLIRGTIYHPLDWQQWEYFSDGALAINSHGRIEAVGDYTTLRKTYPHLPVEDHSGQLILPGLIDTHLHLPQLPIRGLSGKTLLDWLERYAFPAEEQFADVHYAQQLSHQFFNALKANGTTTALVFSSVHEAATHVAFEAAQQSGMRILMGKVMMDQRVPQSMLENTDASLQASQRLAETWHRKNDDLLRYAFTPRFALSCSSTLLEGVANLHRQFPGSYIQSHLAENPEEVQEVEALYQDQFSYAQIYHRFGCLGPRTIMAHGIYLNDSELKILGDTQTRIAHCPTSNFFLKSGFFNLKAVTAHQILFGLGTDIGGGPDLSLFKVMRAMDEMQLYFNRFVKPTEALYYATLGGARVLSLEGETGNFAPGKSADYIVIDLHSLTPWLPKEAAESHEDLDSQLSQLVFLGSEHNLLQTAVRGKVVYRSTAGQTIQLVG